MPGLVGPPFDPDIAFLNGRISGRVKSRTRRLMSHLRHEPERQGGSRETIHLWPNRKTSAPNTIACDARSMPFEASTWRSSRNRSMRESTKPIASV
jgi:hypothetical protein